MVLSSKRPKIVSRGDINFSPFSNNTRLILILTLADSIICKKNNWNGEIIQLIKLCGIEKLYVFTRGI